MSQRVGPVILDLMGKELTSEELEILKHPLVGGVILFARNYESPQQITQLCQAIRKAKPTPLLITVDQEGGRVQRFRKDFTLLPAMGRLGIQYSTHPEQAIQSAEYCGWLMASELLAVGIDLSFAPVLDLNKELNTVIGDRAFHHDPRVVITLAKAFIRGMNNAGMVATGKHFPGHGSVNLDSHLAMPIDKREFKNISSDDLLPFAEFIQLNINALMAAHIVFPAVDDKPVTFSARWLKDILRDQLKFSGIVFSDDLNMKGADIIGNYAERAQAALDAGCDLVLICNNRRGAIEILDHLTEQFLIPMEKLQSLRGKFSTTFESLQLSAQWKKYQSHLFEKADLTTIK